MLAALGFSINTLTMFAMVLAIGLLVDDAIVVVENVERLMSEEGLSPLEATRKSMDQITGALVGIALVLSAVFVPMAFFGGSTGVIYRQFSVTIVSAMVLSVLVALVLTPALCATLLKPLQQGRAPRRERGFFALVQPRRSSAAAPATATACVGMLGRSGRFMAIFAALLVVLGVLFVRLPSAFLPAEDQGMLFAQVHGAGGRDPGAHDAGRSRRSSGTSWSNEKDAVDSVFSVQGFSFGGGGQNTGIGFVKLKDWDERKPPTLQRGRGRRARDGRLDADQGRDGVRVRAAADPGARQRRRLRLLS